MLTTNVGVTTTYFVGAHYEVTNGLVTKYYYAGSQRIAMRKNNVVTYLISDHLGSTSLVTDASGAVINQTKNKAWGETRYSSGTEQTKYTYTGQYSYVSDFGLMFYNARWYDSSLGRFAQADTIVPRGSQGLDRYAYVNNSPINYIDPSGHCPIDAKPDDCLKSDKSNAPILTEVLAEYGITGDGLSKEKQIEARNAADNFGTFYYQKYGDQYGFTSAADAFKKVTGGNITIILDDSRGDCITVGSTITCDADSMNMNSFVHEYFHVFDNNYNALVPDKCYNNSDCLASNYTPGEWITDKNYYDSAYKCTRLECISHPQWLGDFYSYEAFANAGQTWILEGLNVNPASNAFALNQFGDATRDWMNREIPNMLNRMFP